MLVLQGITAIAGIRRTRDSKRDLSKTKNGRLDGNTGHEAGNDRTSLPRGREMKACKFESVAFRGESFDPLKYVFTPFRCIDYSFLSIFL